MKTTTTPSKKPAAKTSKPRKLGLKLKKVTQEYRVTKSVHEVH